MKVYSNKITEQHVKIAFAQARMDNGADIWIDEIRSFKPRRHTYGVEVWAESMSGSRATGHAPIGSYDRSDLPRAASWSDWGYVMAHLFNIDPDAQIGFYSSAADFRDKVTRYQQKGASLDFLEVLS